MKEKLILKVLVGSRAHGLHSETSDYDYRGVYVVPTQEILKLNHKYKGSHWFEGAEDQTTYEIGHFLELATRCNPTILEVFKAPYQPVLFSNENEPEEHGNQEAYFHQYGVELRELFPYIWNPKGAFDAFVGYGLNQRKKMLDNHLDRWHKYAVAYLRTLWNLIDLLKTGSFSLEVIDKNFKELLTSIREHDKSITPGKVVDMAEELIAIAKTYLSNCKQEPNIDKVNDFLLRVRKDNWE